MSRGYKTPGSWSLEDVRHAPAAALITEWKEAQMIPRRRWRRSHGCRVSHSAMNWRSVARFKKPALSDVTRGDDTCSVTLVLPPWTTLVPFHVCENVQQSFSFSFKKK